MADTPLAAKIKAQIRRDGPMGIAEFMALCLDDPEHGRVVILSGQSAGGDGDDHVVLQSDHRAELGPDVG